MKFAIMLALGLVKAETGEDLLYAETRSPGSSEDKVFTMPMDPVGKELPAGDEFYVDYDEAELSTVRAAGLPKSRQLRTSGGGSRGGSSYASSYSYSGDYYYSGNGTYSSYYSYSYSDSDYDYYYGENYDEYDWDEEDDGYDWSMVEDITGEELSDQDKEDLDEIVESIVEMTGSYATRATWGALTGAAALALIQ